MIGIAASPEVPGTSTERCLDGAERGMVFTMQARTLTSSTALLIALVWLSACSDPTNQPTDAGADADGSADGDTDSDADGDSDGDADADEEEQVVATLDAGEATLRFHESGRLILERGETTLLDIPLEAFQVGTVTSVTTTHNYDPYFFEVENDIYNPPRGFQWHRPRAAEAIEEEDGVELRLLFDELSQVSVTFVASADGRFRAHWNLDVDDGEDPIAFTKLRLSVSSGEHFYGLGEVFDHVDHRGHIRAMQLEAAPLESAYNEAHVPIPLLISTSGWGLYIDSLRPGVFDVASEEEDVVEVTYGLGTAAPTEGLSFFLVAEEHPLDVTRHYYEITGFPGDVAPWALGPWIWRDEVDDQATVEDDLRTIRDLDLATTGYWIDRPYASGVNTFDFEPTDYPDPEAMMTLADQLGLAMALWHTPYVDPEDEDSAPLYEHALESGFFPPQRATALASWGPPLDYTNPEAYAWWQSLLSDYRDLGIVGYKLDYAEEVLIGAFGIRLPWEFHDGSNELTMHRGYQRLYHQVYAEMLPEEGGFLICRAAVAGDQVNGTIIWPGDIDANFARHGQEMTDSDGETYVAVGGIPAAVVASSSLGPSGFPLFGSDTGGYRQAPPDRETYIRWFQHTALSTVMQVGTNTNDLPWDLSDVGLDNELLGLYREYARLHLRLFPLFWTLWQRVQVDGRAIQRPLGLAHPELGAHPDDVYLIGDDLLVAPVVERGLTERADVPLPAGRWQNWWSGELYDGGTEVTIPAPLETLPLLLRLWAPIPMLRPTIDTLNPVADTDAIDSFATQTGPLWVRVALATDLDERIEESFTLYDETLLTTVANAASEGCISLGLAREAGTVFDSEVVFELVGGSITEGGYQNSSGDTLALEEAADHATFDESDASWLQIETDQALVKLPADGAVLALTLCSP